MKLVIKLSILIILGVCISCKNELNIQPKNKYLRWVGDIVHDSLKDNLSFKACKANEKVLQYFNLGEGPVYLGEKPTIVNIFKTTYKPVLSKNQTGLIRIRFLVNCEGKAGRFRILQSDSNYDTFEFDKTITSQLLAITKGIENWVILYRDNEPVDYYFYLIFKIQDGKLTEILP